ncbi:MAG: hypothetical protein QW035_01025 [Candidatus Anstonellales archaeon]
MNKEAAKCFFVLFMSFSSKYVFRDTQRSVNEISKEIIKGMDLNFNIPEIRELEEFNKINGKVDKKNPNFLIEAARAFELASNYSEFTHVAWILGLEWVEVLNEPRILLPLREVAISKTKDEALCIEHCEAITNIFTDPQDRYSGFTTAISICESIGLVKHANKYTLRSIDHREEELDALLKEGKDNSDRDVLVVLERLVALYKRAVFKMKRFDLKDRLMDRISLLKEGYRKVAEKEGSEGAEEALVNYRKYYMLEREIMNLLSQKEAKATKPVEQIEQNKKEAMQGIINRIKDAIELMKKGDASAAEDKIKEAEEALGKI